MRRWPLLMAACVAAGCSKTGTTDTKDVSKPGGRPTVAIVTNTTDPFWDLCEAGAKQAAKDFDVGLEFRQPPGQDAAIQTPILDQFVKKGVSGLAVSVIDPKGQKEDLTRWAKKLPLVTMDNDADESTGRRCYIGVENHLAGKAAGRLVKQALPDGGTVSLFIGNATSANAIGRIGGVLEELAAGGPNGVDATHPTLPGLKGKKYGKWLLLDGEAKTDGGADKAVTNARDVLGRLAGDPNVCLVGLYAYNPPAILEAVRAKSLAGKVKVVGFDEQRETLAAVAAGDIVGTVVQDPYNYGYKSVEVLAALARGDESKLVKGSMPYQVVTKDGGPDQPFDGLTIKFPKAADYLEAIKKQLASVGK